MKQEKILVAVRKISDLKEDAEVENFFQCISCGAYLFYVEVPLNDEKGMNFICGVCGKSFPGL